MTTVTSPASKPRVAVCIPTYNQAAYLPLAVESAFSQTYPNVEVWIADDCSTDSTPEVVQALQDQYPHLRYFRQERNLGITGNNNWLLSQPSTEFIVRLDSDDVLYPRYVEELAALLIKYPTVGYAHCDVQEIGEQNNLRRVRRIGGRKEYQSAEEALRAAVFGYRVAANICMFRAALLHEIGYYKENVIYAQDWEMAIRIADAGWGNVHCAQVLASYRVWSDKAGIRPRRKQIEIEDCTRIFEDTLAPAFHRRKWDAGIIARQRKAMALNHATVLDAPYFSPEDRRILTQALQELGASRALSIRLLLLRLGLGPLMRWQRLIVIATKDYAKRVLGALHKR